MIPVESGHRVCVAGFLTAALGERPCRVHYVRPVRIRRGKRDSEIRIVHIMVIHCYQRRALREGKPKEMVAYGVRPYSFLFYTGWPLTYRVEANDLAEALSHDGVVMVLTKQRRLPEVARLLSGTHWWKCAANNRHMLLKNRPCAGSAVGSPVSQQPAI